MAKPERRKAILDATISVLAERGLEGVTHRAVDQAAELPVGSSTYYFPKKSALLLATAHHLAALLEKDCDALQVSFAEIAASQGMKAAIDHVAREVVSYADEAKSLFLARVELTMASARREDLSSVGKLLTAAARRPIGFFLKLMAGTHSDVEIATCVGLIDGIGLMHATGQGTTPTQEQVAAVVRSFLQKGDDD
ncbi:TetR/AcrR family transcriptional regulator [Cognatiyoonia sp. IB215182]|uniref:TetR/AcrR family transcriptional regulator n=1 Tax=Cognatiyoonia sp. IB215182 TaxID=3097353 RepID=UPI002A0E233C|nr:TetR family transcriptional regulator [Cognatiyoonia sp. IB215182]MDX8354518.1 TetR family transcriptional regulator [Cognatiyoonia sp. IB215182]